MFLKFHKHLILPITLFFCFVVNTEGQINTEIHNILFIGNSLTTTNNLPALIKTQAKYSGYNIETDVVAIPNYSIANHWIKGDIQKLIKSKKYAIVIIQQGPSSQTKSKSILIEYGKKIKNICQENNTLLAYFMVWPSLDYYDTFDNVIKNHEIAAKTNNAILIPVGKVWKEYFNTSKKFDYYSSDNFHPSKKGSKIAADVITKIIKKHLR